MSMRIAFRSLGSLLLAAGVATCSDAPTTAAHPQFGGGREHIAFEPVFSPTAAAAYANRADFNISFDNVRIVIVRPVADTVKDTTIVFRPGQSDLTVDLEVEVHSVDEIFDAAMDYRSGSNVVFHGQGKVQAHPAGEAGTPQQITLQYAGVGANAARLAVSPKTANLTAPNTATFSVSAFDANNNGVSVPVTWSVSDPTIATIEANGSSALLTPGTKRGTVTVTARSVTGLSDNASVTVSLPPASMVLVSGGGQTGKVGSSLAQPAVVKVLASDNQGVAGVMVTFAAPTGGAVGPTSVVTDANGQAQSTLTLGTAAGPQSFAAAATGAGGALSVAIPATATPGNPAAVVAVSGSGQQDTVKHALKAPFVARVSDQYGNAVPNVAVTWARTAGSGSLSGTSTTTNGDGLASLGYTLGTQPGPETVTASVSGVASPATFTAQAIPAGPAAISIASGDAQSGRVLQALGAPFVVKVTDETGTPVPGLLVTWSAVNGTIANASTTDASGQASATMTLGTVVGNNAASATASITTPAGAKTVTFHATVQTGIVARLVFKTQPIAGAVGKVMNAVQVGYVDAGGNPVPATNPVTIALGANSANATLGGTLTQTGVAGTATFSDLTISAVGTGYTMVASSPGLPNVTSAAFDVGATSGASQIIFVNAETLTPLEGQPSITTPAGVVPTFPAIRSLDASGNAVANVPITISIFQNSQSIFTATTATDGRGVLVVSSSNLPPTLFQTPGTYSIVATSSAIQAATLTLSLTITPLVAAQVTAVAPVVAAVADPAQSWPATSYPAVRVTSATSVPVPNVPVTFTVNGGGCFTPSEAPSTVNTDANGVAALSAATITIPRTNEGSCRIIVNTGSLTTILSVVVAPATTIKAWTGATSNDWSVGTNWMSGSVPTAADSVFVPGYTLRQPMLSTPATISGLRLEFDGTPFVDVANSVLTINGDLITFGSTSAITASGSGSVVFNKPGPGILSGLINAPVAIGAPSCTSSYSVASPASSGTTGLLTGPLIVNCPLTIQRAVVSVTGSAVIQGNGKLIMPQTGSDASTLATTGDVTFNGADETGFMTGSSTIIVGGNMTIGPSPNAFVAAPTTAQTFQTTGNHSITVVSGAAPVFGQLFVASTGGGNTLTVNGNITADGINVSDGASLVSSGTITTAQAFQVGTGSYSGVNTLVVTGPVVPNLAASAPVRTVLTSAAAAPTADVAIAGAVEVQGTLNIIHNVTVAGNFSVTGSNGELVMQSDNTHLTIGGDATFAGKAATRLTNGILQVGGNFVQSAAVSPQSFGASAGHLTVFASTTGIKTVTFATPDSISLGGSAFAAVQVAPGGGIDIGSNLIVTGLFTNAGQVQFVAQPIATQIGTMYFRDNSRTVVQSGATVNINGPAQFDSNNVVLQLLGVMTAQTCLGSAPGGATFCFGH